MGYNEILADRIREALVDVPKVEEKKMFSGVTFMVDDKMCICVSRNELMCRIDPSLHGQLVERIGCRSMEMKGKEYIGYVMVSEEVVRTNKELNFWIDLALEFNKKAKASPRKKK